MADISYGAIPQDLKTSPDPVGERKVSSSGKFGSVPVGAILVTCGILFAGALYNGAAPFPPRREKQKLASAEEWPGAVFKMGGVLPSDIPPSPVPQGIPLTTSDAVARGWVKTGEECDPLLGEEWLYKGIRSADTSASVYFTPEVKDSAGVLSAIEVQYYGYVEENLVGTYFKPSEDGTYHSLPVAFRNGKKEDLCDSGKPAMSKNKPYLMISPGMANMKIPTTESSKKLSKKWKEGSCIKNMGVHWASDVVGGKDLTYTAGNLVPIMPMYSTTDGTINGIFFAATDRKQVWPADCPPQPFAPCAVPTLNFWDGSPGLTQANSPPFFMCSNFCGDCEFTGSKDGMYTTMHFSSRMFGSVQMQNCAAHKILLKSVQFLKKISTAAVEHTLH